MITASKEALDAIVARAEAADADTRYEHHAALAAMIEAMDLAGQSVPIAIRELEEELRDEAVEAQFDNLPV